MGSVSSCCVVRLGCEWKHIQFFLFILHPNIGHFDGKKLKKIIEAFIMRVDMCVEIHKRTTMSMCWNGFRIGSMNFFFLVFLSFIGHWSLPHPNNSILIFHWKWIAPFLHCLPIYTARKSAPRFSKAPDETWTFLLSSFYYLGRTISHVASCVASRFFCVSCLRFWPFLPSTFAYQNKCWTQFLCA